SPGAPRGGPIFDVRGHAIAWENWRFRFALHPREGLVLYTVGYAEQGRVRSVLYRASLAELFVPYGDPDANWAWRTLFDEGNLGLGLMAHSLTAGADVPADATLLDAVLAGEA